jgi:hypothetical protein
MTEESMMILNLLRDGKISASEAERLLRTVRETGQSVPTPTPSSSVLGQAAQSAAKMAGKALDFLPKPRLDTGKVGEKVGEAAGEALRAAKSAARDVAAEVGKITQQTRQALHFDAPSVFGPDTGRPANNAGQEQVVETAQSDVTWSGASRLILVNLYGDITVTGQEQTEGYASATLTKTAWAETDTAARVILQQAFLASRVENGACRVEVVAPPDAAGSLTADYVITVPQTVSVEVQTTFGSVEAAGVSPALVARSQSGRLAVRRPWVSGAGEARLTTTSGDVLLDGWNTPSGSLRVETTSGDVEAQDIHCGRELTLSSRSGDITITDGSAGTRARVETQSGSVRQTNLRAPVIETETLSGNVVLKEASGALTLKTASGALTGSGLNSPAISLNTVSGSARLSFAAPFSGSAAGTTVSGDLILALWDNSDTRVDLNTTGGTLFSALPLAAPEGDGSHRLGGKLGDGIGSIKMQSVSGDLRIEKDSPSKRRTRTRE